MVLKFEKYDVKQLNEHFNASFIVKLYNLVKNISFSDHQLLFYTQSLLVQLMFYALRHVNKQT